MAARTGNSGILLAGGGFRTGSFQVGVLEAIYRANIDPIYYQGVSVGSLNAAKLVESGSIDELKEIWTRIESKGPKRLFSPRRSKKEKLSPYANKNLVKLIESLKLALIISSKKRFDIVTRNESLNQPEIFCNQSPTFASSPETLAKALLASISIPGFFDPVQIQNCWYSDGLYCMINPVLDLALDTIFMVTRNRTQSALGKSRSERAEYPFDHLSDCVMEAKISELRSRLTDSKIIVIQPEMEIPTLTFKSFKKGDISKYIQHGFEKTEKILSTP